ncbi:MAG: hypothetical protein IJQ67_05460 [Bacilli bacterium]|nr:hypothetical protein [Bacilli bacterium]
MKVKENDPFKKYKLIYSGELLIISIVFLVLGLLKVTGLMTPNKVRVLIFNWITLFGGLWIIIDFFWVLFSKKRRMKNSILDKALALPIALNVIPIDLIYIISYPNEMLFMYLQGSLFLYVFLIYSFLAIYHYFRPLPSLVIAFEEEQRMKEEEKLKAIEEAKKKETEENIDENQ